MSIYDFCVWLENTSLGVAIGERAWLFPGLETIHVLALTLVMGSIAVVDLRLLGFASKKISVKQLTDEVLPYTWVAFAVAAITGALLFTSNATTYYNSVYFRVKMLLLVLAAINMFVFHRGAYRQVDRWGRDAALPKAAKLAGGFSLLFWIGIVICGRLIGFFA